MIKIGDVILNMNSFKDLETAKFSFHIAKSFSKFQRMRGDLFSRKKEVIDLIMDCLRDPEIKTEDKKPALQLAPYMVIDSECLDLFTRARLED